MKSSLSRKKKRSRERRAKKPALEELAISGAVSSRQAGKSYSEKHRALVAVFILPNL